jgi:uncharacterized protein (TIGR00251 family)
MKVLIAEDDVDQLELRSLVLSRSGFETIEASDGPAAVQAAKMGKPECAVIDLRLPTEELGLWLVRALKELNEAIRVFVLTGADPARLNSLPEKRLIEEVIQKGSPINYLLEKLRALPGPVEPKLDDLRTRLREKGSVTFEVKAILRSSKSEVIGLTTDGAVKVKLAAAPDKGKANEELRALLAECFKIAKSSVEFISGESSQRKRVKVSLR